MNTQSNAVATREEPKPLVILNEQLKQRADQYRLALPSHLKPEDLQRTVVMAAQQNPTLLQADRQSLMLACMKAAQDGLLPDGREAALVPFSTRKKDAQGKWYSLTEVVYMPMVYGLRKKILQSGEVASMSVGVVYRQDFKSGRFLYDVGLEPPIRYRPDLEMPAEHTADSEIVGAYSLVKFKDGSWSADVMRRAEIDAVRELSQTGATKYRFGRDAGKPREPSGPWVDHFAEMAKKTVMRRHAKVLPMSGDLFRQLDQHDQDLAIESAVNVLDSVEGSHPVALPDSGTTDDEPERDPNTGMTVVDEETARSLDEQQSADTSGVDDHLDTDDGDDGHQAPWIQAVEGIIKRIDDAKAIDELKSVEAEFLTIRAVLPDEPLARVEGALKDMKAALRRKEKKEAGE